MPEEKPSAQAAFAFRMKEHNRSIRFSDMLRWSDGLGYSILIVINQVLNEGPTQEPSIGLDEEDIQKILHGLPGYEDVL